MLKLLRTLPKVLKYLPSDKAKDARNFMMSFQVRDISRGLGDGFKVEGRCGGSASFSVSCLEGTGMQIRINWLHG